MYKFNEEYVQSILTNCQSKQEIIATAADDLTDGLREATELAHLENIAEWLLSYIEAARRT